MKKAVVAVIFILFVADVYAFTIRDDDCTEETCIKQSFLEKAWEWIKGLFGKDEQVQPDLFPLQIGSYYLIGNTQNSTDCINVESSARVKERNPSLKGEICVDYQGAKYQVNDTKVNTPGAFVQIWNISKGETLFPAYLEAATTPTSASTPELRRLENHEIVWITNSSELQAVFIQQYVAEITLSGPNYKYPNATADNEVVQFYANLLAPAG